MSDQTIQAGTAGDGAVLRAPRILVAQILWITWGEIAVTHARQARRDRVT